MGNTKVCFKVVVQRVTLRQQHFCGTEQAGVPLGAVVPRMQNQAYGCTRRHCGQRADCVLEHGSVISLCVVACPSGALSVLSLSAIFIDLAPWFSLQPPTPSAGDHSLSACPCYSCSRIFSWLMLLVVCMHFDMPTDIGCAQLAIGVLTALTSSQVEHATWESKSTLRHATFTSVNK